MLIIACGASSYELKPTLIVKSIAMYLPPIFNIHYNLATHLSKLL